ncbi:tetratricopeptide repeat protein [Candidatus Poribacteria bacterium]|nr:tetratricopeptide repeat protein [Candidatus Poribacteria bacterium]
MLVIKMKFISAITAILILSFLVSSCGLYHKPKPKPIEIKQSKAEPKEAEDNEGSYVPREISMAMVEEYARIHRIRDLEKAEFYLTHPEYAKEHPYVPTQEDIDYYEKEFAERLGIIKATERERGIQRQWRSKYTGKDPDYTGETSANIFGKAKSINSGLEKATEYYQQNQMDKAIESMEATLAVDPGSPTLIYDLGVMYMKNNNHYEAIENFKRVIDILKSTAYSNVNLMMHPELYLNSCINLGLVYTRIGMYHDAINILKEAVKFKKDDPDANWNLAGVYWHKGDLQQAAAQMRKYLRLEPDDAEAHNIVGLYYYSMKMYLAALEEFKKAAKLEPKEKQYSYNEALVLARLDRYEEAEEAFDRAAGFEEGEYVRNIFKEQMVANKAKKLHNAGCADMESMSYTEAIKKFNQALKLKPDMVETHVNLAYCYEKIGDLSKQIKHLEEAVKINPELANVRYSLGLAYYDAKMYYKAIDELKESKRLNPSFRDAGFKLGISMCKMGRYAEAIPEFSEVVEKWPDWHEAHLNLGTCYMKVNKTDKAIKHFSKAVKTRPKSPEANYNLGAAYMNAGDHERAAQFFKEALKWDAAYRPARIMLSEIQAYKSGNVKQDQ